MTFEKISFRTTEEERKFLDMLSKKYGTKSPTKLMRAFLRDAMGMMGFTSGNLSNQALPVADSSVKTFPDFRVSDGDPKARIIELAATNPNGACIAWLMMKEEERKRASSNNKIEKQEKEDIDQKKVEEQEERDDTYEKSSTTRMLEERAAQLEAFNRIKKAMNGF